MPFAAKEVRTATAQQPALEVDFNAVYKRLLKPALEQAGCQPFRADQEPGQGNILSDMYFELVTADVVLADISILNPNVFYELGVRSAVAPRGLLILHGGWAKRPFDVAAERTFSYNGQLFLLPAPEAEPAQAQREEALKEEVKRLAGVIRNALAVDAQGISSPVYQLLPGLTPPSRSQLSSPRAQYQGQVFADWQQRIRVAGDNGWAGDILTLAEEAPNLYYHGKLLGEAAKALIHLHRFAAAQAVLEELLRLEPDNLDALTQLGLVLGRRGQTNGALAHMERVVEKYAKDAEARGILGRLHKDLWRLQWQTATESADKKQRAVDASDYLVAAIKSYAQAGRGQLSHYNAINVVCLVQLLMHLQQVTDLAPAEHGVRDLEGLITVCRYGANEDLHTAKPNSADAVWAAASLGELALLTGDADAARKYYRQAANNQSTKAFHLSSMLDQLRLLTDLDFAPATVQDIREMLERKQKSLPSTSFAKVAVCSGHMIDAPGRKAERFPERKADTVRQLMARQLDAWQLGTGDLAICGGASGADLIFAELMAERGATVWLFLALPKSEFLAKSVQPAGDQWVTRFAQLRQRPGVQVFLQPERLGPVPQHLDVFARDNVWMINTAKVEADEPELLHAVLVWDEQDSGDGPGGTSDFAARIRNAGGHLAIINPTKL